MHLTRREFIICTAATALLPNELVAAPERETVTWLYGDPYIASVVESGLGGSSFAAAREQAMRFRTSPTERDQYVLGLELHRA